MSMGTVKWYNIPKGYGFIAPDDGGGDVFVHVSAIEASGLSGLKEGQRVSYEMIDGRDQRQMAGQISHLSD